MKRKYDRTIESSSQADVLALMEKYPGIYFTTLQIQKELGLKTREKIAKFLRKLMKSEFVDKKRVAGTNELLYRFKEPKHVRN